MKHVFIDDKLHKEIKKRAKNKGKLVKVEINEVLKIGLETIKIKEA